MKKRGNIFTGMLNKCPAPLLRRLTRLTFFSAVTFILMCADYLSAQEFQTAPVFPSTGRIDRRTYFDAKQGSSPLSQNSPEPTTAGYQPQPPEGRPINREEYPPAERRSEFEQYVSKRVEITENQLTILKNYKSVRFSHTPQSLPAGEIAVPATIVKYIGDGDEKGLLSTEVDVDAGFIIGAQEAIEEIFILLGIESPLIISTDLRQFGYELFRNPPSNFAPVLNVPVGPGYVIGPGDEVGITIWGKIEGQWSVTADRDGNISLPKVGVLGVAGLAFSELKELLLNEFSKYYTGFQMNVTMGDLRTIRVYVVGNAARPGAYTVSSLSTLVTALFEAGGPGKTGTMRDVQVKRNGRTITHFDLYDFLLRGDKSKDIRLMPEDVIFIPPVGELAAVAGGVNNPAIYELKGETTIARAIEMAGGLNALAFKGRVQIERIVDNTKQVVFESGLDDARSGNMTLRSGDLVKVFRVFQDRSVVKIAGAVQRPGEYGFSRGMTAADLISMAGGVKYYAYTKEAEMTRVAVTDKGPVTERVIINLEAVLKGGPGNNVPLKENDYLFVRTVPEWRLYQTVAVTGEVKFPGAYTIQKGETLSSLIERAGGVTEKAYLKGAEFTREKVREVQQRQVDEMVDRLERDLLSAGTTQVATASSSDEARIIEMETTRKRQFIKQLRTIRTRGRIAIELSPPDKLKETAYDIELEDGDAINIPSDPGTVQVIGSVYVQNAFVYEKGRGHRYYTDLAGGYTEGADDDNVYILKANGSVKKAEGGFLGMSPVVESGDTIVVPEELERIAWMRNIKDFTQILYQIAVTAGVLIVAF